MKTSIVLFFFFTIGVTAFAQEGFRGTPFIETTGTAQREIEPNDIQLQVLLREFEDERVKVQLEKLDKDFLDAVRSAGIEKNAVMLAQAGAQLGKLGRKDKEAFREKTYQVRLTSAAQLESLIARLESVRVQQASIVKVWHTEIEKMKLDLKVAALKAAQAKAEALLTSVNASIGKPLMVRDWDMTPLPAMEATAVANVAFDQKMAGAEGPAPEPTSFRKITLQVQVIAQFEIK